MPNHIINTIRLTGDREKINELLESVKDNRFGIGSLDFKRKENRSYPDAAQLNLHDEYNLFSCPFLG